MHNTQEFYVETQLGKTMECFFYYINITLIFINTNWMEVATSWVYQHQLDESTNSLIFECQLEGSFNFLLCTTLPPCNLE